MRPGGRGRRDLQADLEKLGLRQGSVVLVHASMRQVRPDERSAAPVVDALRAVLGRHGTIVVPTQTAGNSTTSPHFQAATAGMDEAQLGRYVAGLPVFDPLTTPAAGMGVLAEYVRTRESAVRSDHPMTSFAALGPRARDLMARHDLNCLLGDRSPLGALYREDAWVLHLGTGFPVATIFHLGEWRATSERRRYRCKQRGADRSEGLVEFDDVPYDDGDFGSLGADFREKCGVTQAGQVGFGPALLYPARAAADHAHGWVRSRRA
jgi:aminoglycoside 3-N-acetyltransferase